MNECKNLQKLYNQLINSGFNRFPPKGTGIKVSNEQGVYIIYSPDDRTRELLEALTTGLQ